MRINSLEKNSPSFGQVNISKGAKSAITSQLAQIKDMKLKNTITRRLDTLIEKSHGDGHNIYISLAPNDGKKGAKVIKEFVGDNEFYDLAQTKNGNGVKSLPDMIASLISLAEGKTLKHDYRDYTVLRAQEPPKLNVFQKIKKALGGIFK